MGVFAEEAIKKGSILAPYIDYGTEKDHHIDLAISAIGKNMSRWSEQFEGQPFHETFQALRDYLDVEVEGIDSEHEDGRRRFSKIVLDFSYRLSNWLKPLFCQVLARLTRRDDGASTSI